MSAECSGNTRKRERDEAREQAVDKSRCGTTHECSWLSLKPCVLRRGDLVKISRGGPEKYHLILLSDLLLTTTGSGKSYKIHQWCAAGGRAGIES